MKRHEPANSGTGTTAMGYIEEGAAITDIVGRTSIDPKRSVATLSDNASGTPEPEHFDVIVIGGGQAGLSAGYHLARHGCRFVILDGSKRIGDSWRVRWDSLRLFTPAAFDGLDGMPFPAHPHRFPTKDEMAAFLEAYAARFSLPVRNGVMVDRLWRVGNRYHVSAAKHHFTADHVIVAMSSYQRPRVPSFAAELDGNIVQLHSSDYRRPSQLKDGEVLLVGAGNSGSEIAMELAPTHKIWMSGRDVGHIPFRIDGAFGRYLAVRFVLRFLFHRLLTVDTPIGRKVRNKILHQGGPLIRVKPGQLAAAGVKRVPRTIGVRDGKPVLADGRVLDVANVIWCTGFDPGFSWIDLPVLDAKGDPVHERGVAANEPGLYFVGLLFAYSASSTMIHGVGRDAKRVVQTIMERRRAASLAGHEQSMQRAA